jgi:hypothetical protein
VGLIIASSNYSRFVRNPNTGEDFYCKGERSEVAINTVITDGVSVLQLPLESSSTATVRRPSRRAIPVGD